MHKKCEKMIFMKILRKYFENSRLVSDKKCPMKNFDISDGRRASDFESVPPHMGGI